MKTRSIIAAIGFMLMSLPSHGAKPTIVFAASPPTTISAAVVAASRVGPVTISVSGSGSSVSLTIVTERQTYTFILPGRDLTQNATSATLDTHGDLKSYGSIHITWQKRTVKVPATKGTKSKCGSTPGTPGSAYVAFVNGVGSARLNLPCLGAVALAISGTDHPVTGRPLPGLGSYQGFLDTLSFTLPGTVSVSLSLHKSYDGQRKVDAVGSVTRSYSSVPTAAPLTSRSQQFHVAFAPAKLQIANDLGTAHLALGPGPKPLKGTDLQMTAIGPAVGGKGSPATACAPAVKAGGASRTLSVKGTLRLETCLAPGSYAIDPSRGFSSIFSSQLQVKPPTPLKLTNLVPANNATNVSTTLSSIVATYTNVVSNQYATATLQSGTDFQFVQHPSLDGSRKTLTFSLTKALQPNSTYKLTITVTDIFNQESSSSSQFSTGS